jgi:hypothetical protein
MTADHRKELEAIAAKNRPVIERWLQTIEPDLPTSVSGSPEWKKLVDETSKLSKGTHGVEAARERILQHWMWDGLKRLAPHLPARLRRDLERFIDAPDGNSREQLLLSALDHADTAPDNATTLRQSLNTIVIHGHMRNVDTYATVVARTADVARLSSRERAEFWREMDPAGLLSRLIKAKPITPPIQAMIDAVPPVISCWVSAIEPELPHDLRTSRVWVAEATAARALPKGSWLVERDRSRVIARWMWKALGLLQHRLPVDRGRFAAAVEAEDPHLAHGLAHKHPDSQVRARAQEVVDSTADHNVDTAVTAVVRAVALANLSPADTAQFWRDSDPLGTLKRVQGVGR